MRAGVVAQVALLAVADVVELSLLSSSLLLWLPFWSPLTLSHRAAYYHDIFVGVVACRLEPFPEGGPTAKRLYLMVLGVLAPYRSRGIGAWARYFATRGSRRASAMLTKPHLPAGSALLREVLSALDKGKGGDVKEAYLHVWEKNAETIPFYERLGFVRGERVENYYTQRLESPHAVVLRRATVPAVGGDAGVVTVPTAAKAAAV